MFHWLASYRKLERSLVRTICAEFFVQLVNAAYFLLFNFYVLKHGYTDEDAANFLGVRFLAVMFMSLPLGFYIRGRRLMPLFRLSALVVPLSSLLIIWAVARHDTTLVTLGNVVFGLALCCMQICFLPFLMRNTSESIQTEAIALHFITWSASTFMLGIFAYLATRLSASFFGEAELLTGVTLVSFTGLFLFMYPFEEKQAVRGARNPSPPKTEPEEWRRIVAVLVPAAVIAIGAGLMIPFVNIFFYKVHGIDYDAFALLGAVSTFIVCVASMYVPSLLKKTGYMISVSLTQLLAIFALATMAVTESFKNAPYAAGVAVVAYLLRQPLMNMANPLISQFTMSYVGERNREMTSAIQQALGSGCWFFSSHIFALLRLRGYSFMAVFSITAMIYAFGVFLYHLLIRSYLRRESKATSATVLSPG